MDRARRRCVPRHHRRLRDDRGRYRHRPYRADVRRRRRPCGQAERHPAAGGRRSRGQASADGRPHGQVFPSGRPRSRVRPHARRCGGLRRVRGAVRQECLRPDAERGRSDARRRSLHEAQVRGQGVPHREAYAQLSPLLAYRQACAVLSARLVVYPHDGRQGPPDRAEPYDRLEARKYRFGPLRQVARKPRRLEPFALALLGNSAADLGYGGSRRAEVHRVGRRAESRDRPFGRGRLHVRESAEGFRRGRFQQGKLR